MTGWIVLLVLAVLVLLVCLVRLGVAAGYDERGGWVKVHLGPKWVTLYPIDPHKAAKRQEKKARKAEMADRGRADFDAWLADAGL